MAELVILAEQDMEFGSSGIEGLYIWQVAPAVVSLTEGEEYSVVWDGEQHKCKAIAVNFNGVDGMGVGNFALAGLGEDTGEPFLFGSAVDGSFSACYTTESDETNKVAIYQVVEDEEPEEYPEGIVLKDRNGNDVAYYGIETVTFDTTTEGKQQTYTKGTAVKGLEIVPDFSGGDMAVAAPDGTLVKSATIKKPEALRPENVRNGEEIGGVVGDFIGNTEEQSVALAMANGDMVIEPSEVGNVLSKVTIQKPETLVPENIAKDINVGGIVGTLEGGGDIGTFGNLKYIIPITQYIYSSSNRLYTSTLTFKRTETERIHVILYPPQGSTPSTRNWIHSLCYGCNFFTGKNKTILYSHAASSFYDGTGTNYGYYIEIPSDGNLIEVSGTLYFNSTGTTNAHYPSGTYYGLILITDTAHTGPATLSRDNPYISGGNIKVVQA